MSLLVIAAVLSACGDGSNSESADSPAGNSPSAQSDTPANNVDRTIGSNSQSGNTTPGSDDANQSASSNNLPNVAGSGQINSVDEIIGDMSLANDARLLGIPDFQWAVNPVASQVAMGADTRGCFAPQWWQNIQSIPAQFKDCDYWTGYVQWFVIFEGEGNAANNVRVETRRAETWYLSKSTGQWQLLGESEGSLWYRATKVNVTWVPGGVDMVRTEQGSTSLQLEKASPFTYHGQWDLDKIEIGHVASDIQAIYSTVQARLVVDNPNFADDRANAVWLLQNGGDYYPTVDTDPFVSIPPGMGLSRSKKITSEWQSFNFANLSTARQDYLGPIPPLTPDQLRSNPPPLK